MGLQIIVLKASTGAEIEAAFATMRQKDVGAIIVGADPLFDNSGCDQLIVLAARNAFQQSMIGVMLRLPGDWRATAPILRRDIVWLVFTQAEFSKARAVGPDRNSN
jgi:hypothetical protein